MEFEIYSKKQIDGTYKSWEKQSKIVVSGSTKEECLKEIRTKLEEWLKNKDKQNVKIQKAPEKK